MTELRARSAPRDRALGDRPDIYAVPVASELFLVHAPLQRRAALVNAAALERIRAFEPGARAPAEHAADAVADLCGTLGSAASARPEGRSGRLRPVFLGLIPTRACNLSCGYCDFDAATAGGDRMDLRMAGAAVDWIAETARENGERSFEVHFFGGEPFVAPEVVEAAVHRGRAVADRMDLAVRFEAATNGVFDEDLARFVGDCFDTVVLSFDGPQEIHDRQRPARSPGGSFADVARTAHLLGRSPVELCLRMCVTSESVRSMERVAAWFADRFEPSIVNFEPLQPTAQSESAGLSPPDPYEFALHCVRAGRVLKERGVRAVYAAATIDRPRRSFCPVGKDAVIVSPDGRASGCYLPKRSWEARRLDMDLGRLGADGGMDLREESVERLRSLVRDKPRCERCFCRWTCAGGCHVNHSFPGCSPSYDRFCVQTRILTACAILESLGAEREIERLLASSASMERLALWPSDRLRDAGAGAP